MNRRADSFVKALLYFLGALATIGFLITKSPTVLHWATSGDYRYGDLYHFSKVKRFKPSASLPSGTNANWDSIDAGEETAVAVEVLFLGDSFGFCDWGDNSFHMQLSKQLGKRFFTVYNNHHQSLWENPYGAVAQLTDGKKARVLLYEIVERSIPFFFSHPASTNSLIGNDNGEKSGHSVWKTVEGSFFSNTEVRHETLVKHSFLLSPLVELWNTAEFGVFQQISAETPAYSVSPPFLFYRDEVHSFQSAHSDESVKTMADNIAALSRDLKQRFNCQLVFMPVPNKVTLYSQFATQQPYDGFLTRLVSALKVRGVRTVELLPAFKQQEEMLYWPTDTHWNDRGIKLAVNETLQAWP